jgi:hypothetical protein
MTLHNFLAIVINDIPGPNNDPQKAEQIHTFLILEQLVVPGSSGRRPRTIKIFAAFISAEWVYVVSNFSGLVRMHVKSKDTSWAHEDLAVGSEVHLNILIIWEQPLMQIVSTGITCLVLSKAAQIGCSNALLH